MSRRCIRGRGHSKACLQHALWTFVRAGLPCMTPHPTTPPHPPSGPLNCLTQTHGQPWLARGLGHWPIGAAYPDQNRWPAMTGYGWTACWSIKLAGPNPWTTIVGQRVWPLACLDQNRWPRGTHYACLRCSSDFFKFFLKENSAVGVSRNAALVSEFR